MFNRLHVLLCRVSAVWRKGCVELQRVENVISPSHWYSWSIRSFTEHEDQPLLWHTDGVYWGFMVNVRVWWTLCSVDNSWSTLMFLLWCLLCTFLRWIVLLCRSLQGGHLFSLFFYACMVAFDLQGPASLSAGLQGKASGILQMSQWKCLSLVYDTSSNWCIINQLISSQ